MTKEVILKTESDELVAEAYEKGIREVVEWIERTHLEVLPEGTSPTLTELSISKQEWQAQLKDWGIKKE